MTYRSHHALALLFLALAAIALAPLSTCVARAQDNGLTTATAAFDPAKVTVPAPRREFRGIWVATVDNSDWPSEPGLTTDQQKAELLLILDRAKQMNLNAVLFQVRPACDALYASPIEPWSAYLTGQMGKAPSPAYDPLEFAVTEAHKRGLELHAWFNPFRVRQTGEAERWPASPDHISKTHPEWVRQYGRLLWLDPGEKAARDYSLSVFYDVVKRYDVDGVHIDDYFYPYQIEDENHKEVDFPDDVTYARYQAGGGTLSRADWRRSNIDDLIQRMYTGIKAIKPWVKVGISPFGIWRPGNPPQIKGYDSYEKLYGDSRRWLHEGWADYFSPQLYWRIEQTPQSFPVLLAWWISENTLSRHIWPGMYTSLASGSRARWPEDEPEFQVKTTRGMAGSTGDVHFSARFLLQGDIATPGSQSRHLFETVYSEPAPIPASPWLAAGSDAVSSASAPAAALAINAVPATNLEGSGWQVKWTAPAGGSLPNQWVVQWRVGGGDRWSQTVLTGDTTTTFIPLPPPPAPIPGRRRGGGGAAAAPRPDAAPDVVAVTALNRVGAASAATVGALPPITPATLPP